MDFGKFTKTQISKLRKGLLETGRDLCLGELCNGKVKSQEMFCRNRHLCKQCNSHRVKSVYRRKGRAETRLLDKKRHHGCYSCGHNNTAHLIRINIPQPIGVVIIVDTDDEQFSPCGENNNTQSNTDAASAEPSLSSNNIIDEKAFICLWCYRLHHMELVQHNTANQGPFETCKEGDRTGRTCTGRLCGGRYLPKNCFYQRKSTGNPYGKCKRCISDQSYATRCQNTEHVTTQKLLKKKCKKCNKKINSNNARCFDMYSSNNEKLINYSRISKNMADVIINKAKSAYLLCCFCGCDTIK